MSLLRPRWLEDLLPPTPAASPRIRSLKGFEPHHLPAFTDPFYADDPIHWQLAGQLAAAAGFFGHVGVQVPSDDSLLVIVDGALVAAGANAETISFDVGSAALATDTSVVKRNRRESGRGAVFERAGLFRITDNTNAITGTSIALIQVPANTMIYVPLGYRLFGVPVTPEQLYARNGNPNIALTVYMWGRMLAKGAR